jgi:hypothetical protein
MRPSTRLIVFAVVASIGCEMDGPAEVTEPQPSFAAVPDLDGMADLIVDRNGLASSWAVYEETFSSTGCTAIEGGFARGTYLTLRFSVTTPNIGDKDMFIGDPNRHIDPDGIGKFDDSDGCTSSRNATDTFTSATTRRTRSCRSWRTVRWALQSRRGSAASA